MKEVHVSEAILGAARRMKLRLEPEQAAAMEKHFRLLQRWNRAVSLTSVRNPETAVALYTEPLQILDLMPESEQGKLVDLGSGGGFPGLILALLRPSWTVLLVERAARKVAFLAEAARRLGLRGVQVLECDLRSCSDLPDPWSFDILTLKAVGAFDLALTLLDQKGAAGSLAVLLAGQDGVSAVEQRLPQYAGRLEQAEIRPIAGRERSFASVIRKVSIRPDCST